MKRDLSLCPLGRKRKGCFLFLKGGKLKRRLCHLLPARKGRHEEVFLVTCHSDIKMAIHCDYIMDYCPRKEASAGVSDTGSVQRNQHAANQHTTQWAGSGGTGRQEDSGWLHCHRLLEFPGFVLK